MEQAYFSNIRSKIIPYLEKAKNNVCIAMAWFTNSELFDAVLDCLHRKVQVDLILLDNAINYMDYAPDFNLFIKAGGILRIAGSDIGFMHHKFCIVDNRTAITGSYNWTYYAEVRNIENIIITDNQDIVKLFSNEFARLKSRLSITSSSLRLSWNDIENREDVDFRELNYEINCICEAHSKPVRKVFETKTEVVMTDIKMTHLSKYAIGVLAKDSNDTDALNAFIEKGTKLPYSSDKKEFYFDSKNEKTFMCKFIYENPDNKAERGLVKEVDLMQIAKDTCDENLPVRFSMELEDNGSLRVDVSCEKSEQKLTISALNSNLVKHEQSN